jgi:hypothetical protein
MLCSISTRLGERELAEIRDLEGELGHTLLAFSRHPVDASELTDEQLDKVQRLEDRLGIALVAVQAEAA